MAEIGEIIKKARIDQGLTLEQVGDYVGVGKSTVSKWETGAISNMKRDKIALLSRILNLSPAIFIDNRDESSANQIPQFDNIYPINFKKVPMLGEIACGEPIWANEEYGEYVDVDEDLDVDFCLRAKGDSMRDARILDGDIVYIKKMPMVDNGDIAAVVIDNEATLKRVYYKQEENELTLVAANPSYEPMTSRGEQLDHIHILGKAIVFMSKVRHRT